MESNYNITNKTYQQKVHNTFKSSDKRERKSNQQSRKNIGKSKNEALNPSPSEESEQKKGTSINKYF